MTEKSKLQYTLLIALCAATGMLLSTLPHILSSLRIGQPIWIADHDDLLYGAYSGYAYHHATWSIQDPVTRDGGVTMYPWMQFMPGILVARLLNVGSLEVNLVWRAMAGASIALAWFLFFAHYFKERLLATALAVFMLADIGLAAGKPLFRHVLVSTLIATNHPGTLLDQYPQLLPQWRLITPALSLPFMLLYWWLLARAREQSTWRRLLLAGASLGLLFYVYFYNWTSASLALAIAYLVDSGFRRVYVHVAWIGVLVGAPALVLAALTKKHTLPDWLLRSDNFVPINRSSELLIPSASVVLLFAAGVWALWKRRDLIYLWAIAVAGLLLENHQVITGLQVQNFHWVYAWGPALSALIVLLVSDAVSRFVATRQHLGSVVVWGGTILLILHVAAAFWLRGVEATRSRESKEIAEVYGRFRSQRMTGNAVPFSQGLAVAGDHGFLEIAAVAESMRPLDHYAVLLSPGVSNQEWDTRIALNALLSGQRREAFVAGQHSSLRSGWGIWTRSQALFEKRLGQRIAAYDSVATRVHQTAVQLGVGYVALPVGVETPSSLLVDWNIVEDGPYWRIWRRRDV